MAGGVTGRIRVGDDRGIGIGRRYAGVACGRRQRGIRWSIGNRCRRRGRSGGIARIDLKGNEAVDRINHQRPAVARNPGKCLRQRHRIEGSLVVRPRLAVEPPDLRVGIVGTGQRPAAALQQLLQSFLDAVGIHGLEHHRIQPGETVIHRSLLDDGVAVAVIGLCLSGKDRCRDHNGKNLACCHCHSVRDRCANFGEPKAVCPGIRDFFTR